MKITERENKRNVVLFKDIEVGEVFRMNNGNDSTYMKVNDSECNVVCLDDGEMYFTRGDVECVLFDAELIVSEVME